MLGIDCLLKNTDYIQGVVQYMKWLGPDMLSSSGKADFKTMFSRLRKEGVEVDVETAGALYIEAFKGNKEYSPVAEVYKESGREFDETARNLLLAEEKETNSSKEKQIGNLSPAQHIARRLVRAFKSDVIVDNSTKTTLRKLQDMYTETMRRLMPETPGEKKRDERSWEQVLEDGMGRMSEGMRDVDGLVHNLETMHKGVNEQVEKLAMDLEKNGDEVGAEQWRQYAKSFRDAVYSVALNHGEARRVIEGALVESGYFRESKSGEKKFDVLKLARDVHDVSQIRERVVSAMDKAGIKGAAAERVADNFQREFVDMKAAALKALDKSYERKRQSQERIEADRQEVDVDQVLQDAVKEWDNYRRYEGREGVELVLSRKEASLGLRHVFEQLGFFNERNGKKVLDRDRIADAIESAPDIRKMARQYFLDKGYDAEKATQLSNAMDSMYEDAFNKLKEHVIGRQKAIEQTWDPVSEEDAQKPAIADRINDSLKQLRRTEKLTQEAWSGPIVKKNLAREITMEAVKEIGFAKETSKGDVLDWKKLVVDKPSFEDLRKAATDYLLGQGVKDADAIRIVRSMEPMFLEFQQDIARHAESMLTSKEKAYERAQAQSYERQSAIDMLAELNALGGFDEAHRALLERSIGTSGATTEDLQSIRSITEAYESASREMGEAESEYLRSAMTREIDAIVARNRNSRAKVLRYTQFLRDWFGAHNFTLIAGPFNLLQNFTSGLESLSSAQIEVKKQTGRTFSDRKLWWDTLKDVAMGGASGDASSKFGHTGWMDNLNTLDFKKHPLRAVGTLGVVLPRAALNGMDAANKAVLRNKGFITVVHEALVKDGWPKQEAGDFVYEMMYGERMDQTRADARKIVDKYASEMKVGKSEAARNVAATRLANDMIRINLEMAGELGYDYGGRKPLTRETVEAAIKASEHGAALALGHEANNPFSLGQQAGRREARRKYENLIKEGRYNQAALQSALNTVYWDGINRLAVGGANWAMLGFEASGLKLLPSIIGLRRTENQSWDFRDPDAVPKVIEQSMKDRLRQKKQITRALVGLTKATAIIGGMAAVGAASEDESDDESALRKGSEALGDRYGWKAKALLRVAGPVGIIVYLSEMSKGEGEGAALDAGIDAMVEITNSNPAFTAGGKAVRASGQAASGKPEKATGTLGTIVGDVAPGIPVLPAYMKSYDVAREIATGEKRQTDQREYPLSATQGYFYKGLVHRLANNFDEDQLSWLGWQNWAKSKPASAESEMW